MDSNDRRRRNTPPTFSFFWWWHDRLWLTLVAPLVFGLSAVAVSDNWNGTGLAFTLTLVVATFCTEYFVRNIAQMHGSTIVVMFILCGVLVGLNVQESFVDSARTRGFPVSHHGEISLMLCNLLFGYILVFGYATLAEVWMLSKTRVPEAEERAEHAQSTMSALKEAKRGVRTASQADAAKDADTGSVSEKR